MSVVNTYLQKRLSRWSIFSFSLLTDLSLSLQTLSSFLSLFLSSLSLSYSSCLSSFQSLSLSLSFFSHFFSLSFFLLFNLPFSFSLEKKFFSSSNLSLFLPEHTLGLFTSVDNAKRTGWLRSSANLTPSSSSLFARIAWHRQRPQLTARLLFLLSFFSFFFFHSSSFFFDLFQLLL